MTAEVRQRRTRHIPVQPEILTHIHNKKLHIELEKKALIGSSSNLKLLISEHPDHKHEPDVQSAQSGPLSKRKQQCGLIGSFNHLPMFITHLESTKSCHQPTVFAAARWWTCNNMAAIS